MRIFEVSRHLEVQQLFFVECWASMSCLKCLDSDRVSYNNVLNSVLELLELYSMGQKHRAAEKRKHVFSELSTFLKNESVLKSSEFRGIPSQLLEVCTKGENPLEKNDALIVSFLQEFKTLLNLHYRPLAIAEIRELLVNQAGHSEDDLEAIYLKTNALLSHVVTLGMPTIECFALCKNYFWNIEQDASFIEAFEQFADKITLPKTEYTVHLTLQNKVLYQHLESIDIPQFDDCQFSLIPRTDDNSRDFHVQATLKVFAISHGATVQIAEKRVIQIYDLFAYFLPKSDVNILKNAVIKEVNQADSIQITRSDKQLSNPLDRSVNDELSVYMSVISHLNNHGSEKTNNKVAASFRFFQNGVNEKSLESRFTSLWSALESLTLIDENGSQKHDEHVLKAVLPCVALDYPVKQLFALRGCAKTLNWDPIPTSDGPLNLKDAEIGIVYKAIKEQAVADLITERLNGHPYAQFKFKKFILLCASPIDLENKIHAHKQKVELHINRLYRIRNAIVHNASTHDRLELLIVNLEHYLRCTLNALIYTIDKSKSILSPEEAFIRYQHDSMTIFSEMYPPRSVTNSNKRGGLEKQIQNGTLIPTDQHLSNWLNRHH